MRIDLFVAFCVASGFLRSAVCSALTVRLSASANTDGRLSSWNGWASSSYTWIIEAPLGQKVLLSFDELRVGYSRYMCDTYLEVQEGEYWGPILIKQCDTSTPPSPVYSSGRWLRVIFSVRSVSSSYYRVSAKYRALPVFSAAKCPKVLLGNNTGVIYSPGFPNNYLRNTNCYWNISAPRPSYDYLLLNFTVLKLYSYGSNCHDYVIVRDGRYSWSDKLEKYCKSSNSPVVLVPSGSDARVEFKSDFFGSTKGFLLFIRFMDYRYATTAPPEVTRATPTPHIWWATTAHLGWATTAHLDSTHRGLAIGLPIVVGVILTLIIIAVVMCEKSKRQSTPPPLESAPLVVELQTFPQQVPVPTQPTQQPVTHVANSPTQFADEPRAELAAQTGRELHPPNNTDGMTFSNQPPAESRDPVTQQPDLAQEENCYEPLLPSPSPPAV